MDWPSGIEKLRDYVFSISTPRGSGTGFLVFSSEVAGVCVVATAAHVIDNAHYWEEPIRLHHLSSGSTAVLRSGSRAVFLDESIDTGAVAFEVGALPLPKGAVQLSPPEKHLRVGHEMGWIGFPGIAPGSLCFFSGRVSAWLESRNSYLVDGVAINGVSGGPAFHVLEEEVVVIGVVSAYIPNRLTGDILPGLCEIRDVRQFQNLARTFLSLDQAKRQETTPVSPPPPAPDAMPERPP
jgi:hypothetical protein